MRQLASYLAILTVVLLWPAHAAAQAVETFSVGQYAELNTVSDRADSRLSVTVSSGEYALAWADIDQRWAVAGEEKLYVLRFQIRNDGQQVESIEPRLLRLLVTDDANRSYDEPLAFRLPGTSRSADARLVQSQSIDIETAFLIPADAAITSVFIADARSDRGPGVQFSVNSAATLPRALSPDGVTIDPIVAARSGTWYPLGVTDVRVDSIDISSEPILNLSLTDDEDIAVVAFTARNRANSDVRIHRGLYRDTAVATADGDRDLLRIIFRDSDRDTDFPLLPGAEVSLRSLFRVPSEGSISSVDFVERIGTRGGLLSRRYRIGEGGSAGAVAGTTTPAVGVAGGASQASGSSAPAADPVPSARAPSAAAPAGGVIVAERAPVATGTEEITEIPAQTPPLVGEATIPEGVVPEEVPTLVRADPVPIIPQATVVPEVISVPNADFIVRLRDYYVAENTSESRPEYQLMVFNFRGRFDDPVFILPDERGRRDHITSRDVWPGTRISLSSAGLNSYYRNARPFEVMALVFIMIERDDSSGSDREAYMRRMHQEFLSAFASEFMRDLGVDFDDLSPADADRVVAQFETSAEVASDAMFDLGLRDREIGGALDADEVSAPSVFFWINADDQRNPGIITHSRLNGRAEGRNNMAYPWPSLISTRINPEVGPNNILRFELSRE